MDDGVVRLGEREDDAVQLRAVAERLLQLEAKIVLIRLAEQVELSVLVQHFRMVVKKPLRQEHLPVPVVEGLADRMRELADRVHLSTRFLDQLRIDLRVGVRIRVEHRQPVDAPVGRVAVAAHLERVDVAVLLRLLHHPLHVPDVNRRRMHDRPADLRSGTQEGHRRTHQRERGLTTCLTVFLHNDCLGVSTSKYHSPTLSDPRRLNPAFFFKAAIIRSA